MNMGLYDSVVNNEYNKQRYQYQLSQLFTSISWGTGCTGETRCSLTHPPPPPTTKSPLQKAEKTVSVDSPFYLDLLGHRVYRGYQVFPNPPNPPPPPPHPLPNPPFKKQREQYRLTHLFTSISWGTGCTGEARCSLRKADKYD